MRLQKKNFCRLGELTRKNSEKLYCEPRPSRAVKILYSGYLNRKVENKISIFRETGFKTLVIKPLLIYIVFATRNQKT
jgi:hypothetical protein